MSRSNSFEQIAFPSDESKINRQPMVLTSADEQIEIILEVNSGEKALLNKDEQLIDIATEESPILAKKNATEPVAVDVNGAERTLEPLVDVSLEKKEDSDDDELMTETTGLSAADDGEEEVDIPNIGCFALIKNMIVKKTKFSRAPSASE